MIVVDQDRFVAAIRARAAAEPNKVYRVPTVVHVDDFGDEEDVEGTCVYVVRNEDDDLIGSCLLGWGLIDAGVKPEVLDVGEYAFAGLQEYFGGMTLSKRVVQWATEVQDRQDCGTPWGLAVESADEKYGDPLV